MWKRCRRGNIVVCRVFNNLIVKKRLALSEEHIMKCVGLSFLPPLHWYCVVTPKQCTPNEFAIPDKTIVDTNLKSSSWNINISWKNAVRIYLEFDTKFDKTSIVRYPFTERTRVHFYKAENTKVIMLVNM